jgi:hypothetical protein
MVRLPNSHLPSLTRQRRRCLAQTWRRWENQRRLGCPPGRSITRFCPRRLLDDIPMRCTQLPSRTPPIPICESVLLPSNCANCQRCMQRIWRQV